MQTKMELSWHCTEQGVTVLLLILATFSMASSTQNSSTFCLQTNSENGPPELMNYGNRFPRFLIHHQAIIPSYKLECCGNITEWGVDVHPGGQGTTDRYTLDLQVWRPSPTVNDSTGTGCYSLVGNNRFTSIPLRNLVARVTPSPQDYIQFRPGDVPGVYVEEARQIDDGVIVLTSYDRSTDFTSELVWYGSIAPTMATSQNGDCPYSVGSNGVLNTTIRGAPVISASIAMYSCSPTPLVTSIATQVSTTINSATLFPITSSPIPSPTPSDGGGRVFISATPLPIALTIGIVVPLLLIIIILTIVVIVLVAVLLKTKYQKDSMRGEKPETDLTTNAAYGLLHEYQEMDEMCMGMPPSGRASLHIYESLPSLSTTSRNRMRHTQQSLVYNEAYGGRNEVLATTDFL